MSAFFLSSYSGVVRHTMGQAVQPQLARNAQCCVDTRGLSHLIHMSSVLIVIGVQKPHWILFVILQ